MKNAYNYFHDFKKPVEYATIKFENSIENGRSLKLRQTRRVNASSLSSITSTQQNRPQTSSVAAVTATNRLQPLPAIGHSRNRLWFGLAIGRLPGAQLNGLDGLTTAM